MPQLIFTRRTMRIAEAHNDYYFHEAGSTGAIAYVGAENWGVHFMIKGRGKNANQDFATFALSAQDGIELQGVTDHLLGLVPPPEGVEDLRRLAFERGFRAVRLRPAAPWVHDIRETDDNKWDLVGRPMNSDDMKPVGKLSWQRILSKDVLVTRIEEVDSLVFKPDTFRQFVAIAANKPELSGGSIWGRL